jgi:hypothetical protein
LKDLPTSRRRSVVFRPINLCRVRVRRLRNPAIKSGLLHANGTVPRPLPRGKTSRINGLARRRGIPFYLAIVRSVSHSLQSRAFIDSTTFRSDFGADCSPRNAAQARCRHSAQWLSEAPFARRFSVRQRQSGRLRDARPRIVGDRKERALAGAFVMSGGWSRRQRRVALTSPVSFPVPAGISKSGASPLPAVARTLSAKPLSEPQAFR